MKTFALLLASYISTSAWSDKPLKDDTRVESVINNLFKDQDGALELYVPGDDVKSILMAIEKTTEDVMVCLCRHMVVTKGVQDPLQNPCADKYCQSSYESCAPRVIGDLELCVVQEHAECAFNWPDFSNAQSFGQFVLNMMSCFAPPTPPPTNASLPSDVIVVSPTRPAMPAQGMYLEDQRLEDPEIFRRFPPYHRRSPKSGSPSAPRPPPVSPPFRHGMYPPFGPRPPFVPSMIDNREGIKASA